MLSFFRRHSDIRREAERFADTVVRCHADPVRARKQPRLHRQLQVARAADQTARFAHEQRLGFFGKASLAHKVEWRLRELGQPEEIIASAMEALLHFYGRPVSRGA